MARGHSTPQSDASLASMEVALSKTPLVFLSIEA